MWPRGDLPHRHRLRADGLGERAAAAQPAARRDIDRDRHVAGQRERHLHDVGIGNQRRGSHGRWAYSIVKRVADVGPTLFPMAT